MGLKRESGKKPLRTRHCIRKRKLQYVTVHLGWEGAASRIVREPGDLPI